jgi:hypothetical protein
MTWATIYWMWTTGTYTTSITASLDPNRSYMVTGYLTQKDGGDYAHVYISMVCTISGDQRECGIRDDSGDDGLSIVENVSGADSVTIKLTTKGGRHRAEGVIWEL